MTLLARQLLIIEPRSVREHIQKDDEATVGSQLTFTASNKGRNSSRGLVCISHLVLGRDVSRMSCYRARYPQGGTVPWGWRWPLSVNPRAWLQISNEEGQQMGALFLKGSAVLSIAFSLSARGPATLSDLPRRLQHSLPIQQFSAFYLLRIQTFAEN